MGIASIATGVGGGLLLTAATLAGPAEWGPDTGHRAIALEGTTGRVAAFEREGRITRIYGDAFSTGATPEQSVERFLSLNAGVLGVDAADLVDHDDFGTFGLGFDPITETFRFTALNYAQTIAGVPVFRGRLIMLVRNEGGYPLVLASSALRPMAGFEPAVHPAFAPGPDKGHRAALAQVPGLDTFQDAELVVWAGVDEMLVQPRLAHTFEATGGVEGALDFKRWTFVTDVVSGEILFMENGVLHADVSGHVDGQATVGPTADACAEEAATAMPYIEVTGNGSTVFTDINGNYTLTGLPSGSVTVSTQPRGQWFDVYDEGGPLDSDSVTISAPAAGVDLMLNADNDDEYLRAETNSYLHANLIRDWVLSFNPSYPTIAGQQNFRINVNINNDCNATYSGSAINFYRALGGCNNTGFSSVVYHEYGHHLVQTAGSGQGAYGEGMGDTVSALLLDDPRLGVGFSSCATGIRTADNTCQYDSAGCSSCGSEVHACGNLISGCVWDTREALEVTNPGMGLEIVTQLALDSLLLHTGSSINPDITIDYLVLDDDDGTIFNGTPHYNEIAQGFGLHGMDAPELQLVTFAYPDGIPSVVAPGEATEFSVDVLNLTGAAVPGSGRITYTLDGGSPVTEPMAVADADTYIATLPGAPCASGYDWFITVEVEDFGDISDPDDGAYRTVVADAIATGFHDDFEASSGWVFSGEASDGGWEIGVPVDCDRGDPPSDADGSGNCALTDNAAQADCNTDVDGGSVVLTSPVMDATGIGTALSYWRWYSNNFGAEPYSDVFTVEITDDGGSTWQTLETVGPTGPEVEGGWYYRQFDLSAIPDFALNDQFRVRFTAFDSPDSGSVIEAGVDGVRLESLVCDPSVPEDITGDGVVDVQDLLALLSAWGPCGGCPEDVDGDGQVGVSDLLAVLAAWG